MTLDRFLVPFLALFSLEACAPALAQRAATPVAVVINSTSPTDGAAGVSLDAEIRVAFSGAVTPTTVNDSTFTLMQGPQPIAGMVQCSGETAEFVPASPLEAGATYTAIVTTRVDEATTGVSPGTYSWTFTTRGA